MSFLRYESKYTKISLAILCVLGVSIVLGYLNLPLRMSRICWIILLTVSFVLSILGKKRKKTLISSILVYVIPIILIGSLVAFKTLLFFLRMII